MTDLNARQRDALNTTQDGKYPAVCDSRTRNALIRRSLLDDQGNLTYEGRIAASDEAAARRLATIGDALGCPAGYQNYAGGPFPGHVEHEPAPVHAFNRDIYAASSATACGGQGWRSGDNSEITCPECKEIIAQRAQTIEQVTADSRVAEQDGIDRAHDEALRYNTVWDVLLGYGVGLGNTRPVLTFDELGATNPDTGVRVFTSGPETIVSMPRRNRGDKVWIWITDTDAGIFAARAIKAMRAVIAAAYGEATSANTPSPQAPQPAPPAPQAAEREALRAYVDHAAAIAENARQDLANQITDQINELAAHRDALLHPPYAVGALVGIGWLSSRPAPGPRPWPWTVTGVNQGDPRILTVAYIVDGAASMVRVVRASSVIPWTEQ